MTLAKVVISILCVYSVSLHAQIDAKSTCAKTNKLSELKIDSEAILSKCLNYQEVTTTEIGPRSSLKTNNSNSFNPSLISKNSQAHFDCDLESFRKNMGRLPCPGDMQWVCSKSFKTSVCMDRDLVQNPDGKPMANLNRKQCEDICRKQGKRLLTNNEWLVGCTGTPIEPCLNYRGTWPPGHFSKVPNHVCQKHSTTSSQCMTSPDLTGLMPEISAECRSEAGVRGCVGTLGQWVSDQLNNGNGRFNGGLFPQKASSVIYSTVAHGPGYSDYSIGCRCGKSID